MLNDMRDEKAKNTSRSLEREKAAYLYYCALRDGDSETVVAILSQAETDAVLEKMLLDVGEMLATDFERPPAELPELSGMPESQDQPGASCGGAPPEHGSARRNKGSANASSPSARTRGIDRLSTALNASLDMPDAPFWRNEGQYSPFVAQALLAAYAHIRNDRNYAAARRCVLPSAGKRMSVRQRLHLTYVLALAYSSETDHAHATHYLDKALKLASRLEDSAASARCHYLYGSIESERQRYKKADEQFRRSLLLLRQLGANATPADLSLEAIIRDERSANRIRGAQAAPNAERERNAHLPAPPTLLHMTLA